MSSTGKRFSGFANPRTTDEYVKAINIAFGMIMLHMDAGYHHTASDCKEARIVRTRRIHLKQQLFSIKMAKGDNVFKEKLNIGANLTTPTSIWRTKNCDLCAFQPPEKIQK